MANSADPISPPTSLPSLLPDEADPGPSSTNTHALLLPHQALFAHPILQLLRDHYATYGTIAHWAPVRAFGRVIIVWDEVADADRAKREGDYLHLDVDLPEEKAKEPKPDAAAVDNGDEEYFHRPKRNSKGPRKGITLRLHPLPYTPINPDPASFLLAPPSSDKNFLISPPGSPPEGWEPIVEDAPNSATLADDLQRALESLQLNGMKRGRRGSKEVILDEGGVRVEVEDTTQPDAEGHGAGGDMEWEGVEEYIDARQSGAWRTPSQELGSALGTPAGKMKMIPTARPPM